MAATNMSASDQANLQIFAMQAPGYGVYIIAGITAITNNILIIVTIGKSSALHNKSMCLLASLAAAEIAMSVFMMLVGVKRLLYFAFGQLENISHLSCVLQMLPMTAAQPVATDLTLALSIDRFLALKFPAFYRAHETKKYITLVNLISWVDGLLSGLVTLIGVKQDEVVPVCTAGVAHSPTQLLVHSNLSNGKVFLTIAVYSATAFMLFKRVRALRNVPLAQRRQEREKLELAAYRTILVVSTMYAVCTLITFFGANIFSAMSKEMTSKYLSMLGTLMIINSASHLFIYLSLSKLFRCAFRMTICAKNSVAIDPWSSSTGNGAQPRK